MGMTIYDIAKLAGVSASTVSRVINNKPGIKDEKKRKIMKLIEKHQFQLNEAARGLSTNSTKMIGMIIADIRNAHYTELAYVVQTYLQKQDYCTIIVHSGLTPEEMAVGMRTVRQRNVDGLIIIGSVFQNDFIENEIVQSMPDTPVVFANGYFDLPNVYGVLVDEYNGLKRCVELLYDRGYQSIAYIGNPYTVSNQLKEKGYREGVAETGNHPIVIEIETKTLSGADYEPLEELLTVNKDVDAIICANDYLAAEAMQYISDKGVNVPDEFGFIGINNDKYCEITTPKLTSLDNRMSEMGLMSASMIVDVINGEKSVDKVMLISELVIRDSIRLEK